MVKELSQKESNKTHPAYSYKKKFILGPWTTHSLFSDPIHLAFVLSRYKFVARMLTGKEKALEIGCGDALGIPIVAQFVGKILAIDIDEKIIASDKKRLVDFKNIRFEVMDFRKSYPGEFFDAVYSIDVLEHIDNHLNDVFMRHICASLKDNGICIIGTPNISFDKYASLGSRSYHINLHSFSSLQKLLSAYFENVFMFSMSDEAIHTSFAPMAHYLFGIGVGVKK